MCYENGKGVPQNLAEAVKWYRRAARQGHSKALFNLGVCFVNGSGCAKAVGDGVTVFRRAAVLGHSGANLICDEPFTQQCCSGPISIAFPFTVRCAECRQH